MMLLCIMPIGSQAKDPPFLARQRSLYEQKAAAIEKQSSEKLTAEIQSYVRALAALSDTFQKAGDLESMEAADLEKERVTTDKSIADADIVQDPPALRKLQTRFMETQKSIENEESRLMAVLTDRYCKGLNALKIRLVQAERIKEASAVAEEIDRVESISQEIVVEESSGVEDDAPASPDADSMAGNTVAALPADLKHALLLAYTFDRNDRLRVNDISGNGYTGKVKGAQWITGGKQDGAYEFRESRSREKADYIFLGKAGSLKLTSDFTIMVWIKMEEDAKNRKADHMVKMLNLSGGGTSYELTIYNDRPGLMVGSDADDWVEYYPEQMNTGQWHHVAAIKYGDMLLIYMDGKRGDFLKRIGGGNFEIPEITGKEISNKTTDMDLIIGARRRDRKTTADRLAGVMDEVMIFKRALSEEEIRTIYDLQK